MPNKYIYNLKEYDTLEQAEIARSTKLDEVVPVTKYITIKHITKVAENTFFIPEEKLTENEVDLIKDTEWYMCASMKGNSNHHVLGSEVQKHIKLAWQDYIHFSALNTIFDLTDKLNDSNL